jgi:hypothetical protein
MSSGGSAPIRRYSRSASGGQEIFAMRTSVECLSVIWSSKKDTSLPAESFCEK